MKPSRMPVYPTCDQNGQRVGRGTRTTPTLQSSSAGQNLRPMRRGSRMKPMPKGRLLATVAGCTLWFLAPGYALAEGIETVVVTATRTAQDIQKVPLSMEQLSGSQLDNNQVRQPIDLQKLVSGLTI